MDFVIGFIAGLIVGAFIGMFVASLASISREGELMEKMKPDPCENVVNETIETLKRQGKPTCLTDDERREELEERYKRE